MMSKYIIFIETLREMREAVQTVVGMDLKPALVIRHDKKLTWENKLFSLIIRVNDYSINHLKESVLNKLSEDDIAAILTFNELGIIPVAALSEVLGKVGNSVSAATASRNKFLMKQKLQENNIAVSIGNTYKKIDNNALNEIKFPAVIKPIAGSSSFCTIRVDSETDIKNIFKRIRRTNQTTSVALNSDDDEIKNYLLVEEFLAGPEVTCDLILYNGTPVFGAICDKPYNLEGPTFLEETYITPSSFPVEFQEKIVAFTIRITNVLGIKYGPVHSEIRLTSKGLFLLEIASRMGAPIGQMIKDGAEINYYSMIINSYLQPDKIPADVSFNSYAAWIDIHLDIDGEIIEYLHLDQAIGLEGITVFDVKKKPGTKIYSFPLNLGSLITIHAKADSPEEIKNIFKTAFDIIRIKIRKQNNEIIVIKPDWVWDNYYLTRYSFIN